MSSTFNPYAFIIMAALINATKEITMIKHPTEQNHTRHTHGQKKAAGVLRHFKSYSICSMAKSCASVLNG